jgi:uncharacterized SAM-binding protein YcdF (DUF218 family)
LSWSWTLFYRALGSLFVVVFLALAYTPVVGALCELVLLPGQLGPADAIVVLGSGLNPDGLPTASSERKALTGIELHRRGLAPLLVFVGADAREGAARARLAGELGVGREAMLMASGAPTTRDEAERVASLLRQSGARRLLLVTGGVHMRRAVGLFAKQGFEVAPAPIADTYCWEPVAEQRIMLATQVLRELAAIAYYRLAGYL